MQYFQRILRDGASALVSLDHTPKLDLSRPVIVHFSGYQTVDGVDPENLDINTRIIETHLGGAGIYDAPNAPQFFTLTYSRTNPETLTKAQKDNVNIRLLRLKDKNQIANSRAVQVNEYRKDAKNVSADAQAFVQDVLMPALHSESTLDDLSTIQRKLGNLTICSNSYGSIFSHEVGTALKAELLAKHAGTEEAIDTALQSVVNIAAPNVSRRDVPQAFTNIFMEGRGDPYRRFVQTPETLKAIGEKSTSLKEIAFIKAPLDQRSRNSQTFKSEEEQFLIKSMGKDALVLFTPVKRMNPREDDFGFVHQVGDERSFVHDADGHDPRLHMSPTSNERDVIGDMYGRILRNAVMRQTHTQHLDYVDNPITLIHSVSQPLTQPTPDTKVGERIGFRPLIQREASPAISTQ